MQSGHCQVLFAPNTTFVLRTKDEGTAKYFLNASARQMRAVCVFRRWGYSTRATKKE